MKGLNLTAHAIARARHRWLEPTDAEAARAIRLVIERGTPTRRHGCTVYQYGTRCARVNGGAVVTVTVHHMKRLNAIRSKARRDLKERRHR